MAIIMVAKTASVAVEKVGDVLAFFEDDHPFSARELGEFGFIRVAGYMRAELTAVFPVVKQALAWKLAIGDRWTFDEPQKKRVWFDEISKKWKELAIRPKASGFLNIAKLTQNEKDVLANPTMPGAEKEKILLDKTTIRLEDYPENRVEISELSLVSVIR